MRSSSTGNRTHVPAAPVRSRAARLAVSAGLALTLALGGAAALPATALAAEAQPAITIDSAKAPAGSYKVYYLVAGDFGTDGAMGNANVNDAYKGLLTDALKGLGYDPGTGATDAAILDKLVAASDDKNVGKEKVAKAVAAKLAAQGAPAATATVKASDGTATYNGPTGYYLVVSDPDAWDPEAAMTSAMLVTLDGAGTATTAKIQVPTLDKQVKDGDAGNGWDGTWSQLADAGLVDGTPTVPTYQLVGTLPSNIGDYDTYQYKFVDTLPTGFDTANDGSELATWNVSIKTQDGKDLSDAFAATVTTDEKTHTSTVMWAATDLKAALKDAGVADADLATTTVTLVYTPTYDKADLDRLYANQSELGKPQVNSAHIEFSNNPVSGGDGLGHTPDHETYLYSFNLQVKKVDDSQEPQPLTGAKFTLTGADGKTLGRDITATDDGTFTFTGLEADVEYTLTETQTPEGKKAIEPIKFKLKVTKDGATNKVTAVSLADGSESDPSNAATFTVTDATVTATVVNVPGPHLPNTGRAGIAAGVVVGGAIIAVSAVKIVRDRKGSEADQR